MGNTIGSISQLGISALATTTPSIDRTNLLLLKNRSNALCSGKNLEKMDEQNREKISREELQECLASVKVKTIFFIFEDCLVIICLFRRLRIPMCNYLNIFILF